VPFGRMERPWSRLQPPLAAYVTPRLCIYFNMRLMWTARPRGLRITERLFLSRSAERLVSSTNDLDIAIPARIIPPCSPRVSFDPGAL